MKKPESIYIRLDLQGKYLVCNQVNPNFFISCFGDVISNMLLLEHDCSFTNFHPHTHFEYILKKEIKILQNTPSEFGTFCWVDFQSALDLNEISQLEIAELLYFRHFGFPLYSPFCKAINNRFAYWGHDDGWYTRVYFREQNDISRMIGSIFTNYLGISFSLHDLQIRDLLEVGVILDLRESNSQTLAVYRTGRVNNMDLLDEHKKKHKRELIRL